MCRRVAEGESGERTFRQDKQHHVQNQGHEGKWLLTIEAGIYIGDSGGGGPE